MLPWSSWANVGSRVAKKEEFTINDCAAHLPKQHRYIDTRTKTTLTETMDRK